MKQKNSSNTSKKFNKHHHHEEFLLYKNINEKEALCPSCNHPLGRHKIRIPHHCTERLCHCKLSRLEAKTDYFKLFMKERRNQIGYSYTPLMAKGSNHNVAISQGTDEYHYKKDLSRTENISSVISLHKHIPINEFINIAAHEIRTPIQPIISFTELLQQEGIINNIERSKEFLKIIFRNSKRLKQLSDEILDIARIESGSFSLNKEKFNLKELITDILKEYEQTIQHKKNLKLIYESSEINEIIIEADRNRLCQAIQNLLKDAIQFTNEGSITVVIERKENEILVSIKDTGTGIHLESIVKTFYKICN